MKKRTFILISVGAVGGYLLLLFFVTHTLFGNNNPTPTPSTIYAGESANGEPKNGATLVKLIEALPYTGKHFSLSYDNNKISFLLNIDPADKEAGNTEFESFIKAHGLNNESDLLKVITTNNPM